MKLYYPRKLFSSSWIKFYVTNWLPQHGINLKTSPAELKTVTESFCWSRLQTISPNGHHQNRARKGYSKINFVLLASVRHSWKLQVYIYDGSIHLIANNDNNPDEVNVGSCLNLVRSQSGQTKAADGIQNAILSRVKGCVLYCDSCRPLL